MKNVTVMFSLCFIMFACTKSNGSVPAPSGAPVSTEPLQSEYMPKQHVLILQYETQQQLGNSAQDVLSLFDKNVFITSKFESFYNEAYNLMLKVNSGELVKGDKVFLFINVHGGKKNLQNQQGHIFTAEDGDFNITRLSALIQTMLNKGIKVAISDQSCYSGDSLEYYKNEPELKNLCVITADSNKQVAIARGVDNFLSFLKVTKSFDLETAYVNGREGNYYASPGINSDIFHDFHRRTISLQSQLGRDPGAGNIWLYLNKYSSLDGKKLQTETLKKDILEPLKMELKDMPISFEDEFKSLDMAIESFSQSLNEMYYNDSEIFNFLNKTILRKDGTTTTYLEKLVYTASGQQSSDVSAWTKYNMDIAEHRTPSISKEEYDLIEKRFKSSRGIDLANDPELEKIKDKFKNLENGDLIFKIALGISESNMHKKFYIEQLRTEKSETNPCREFTLNQN